MFDENEHLHPQNNDEGPRHIHRGIKRSEPDEVEVDSADFFSPEPPRPKAPTRPAPTPPSEPPKSPVPPRKQWEPLHPSEPASISHREMCRHKAHMNHNKMCRHKVLRLQR